ncbi:hypothetical protein [Streptomyces sp. WAC06614]|uniref:hypothetical protein n=1 Tax=Streptomyces sp. WAC06614 TaxID=2487416 RepID=UPI00163CB4FA|nr:hypothetical protein [Streptomyces sp. WAC06614]
MHPTRTTTTLLLGVAAAVSAVSGCVNVTPAPVQPASAPSAGVPPQHGPRGGEGTSPVVVQAPALEALKAAPDRAPDRPAQAPARQAASQAPVAEPEAPHEEVLPPAAGVAQPAVPEDDRPSGDGPRRRHRPPHERQEGEVPRQLIKKLPMRPSDVCALGRRHGQWGPDSPEARICAGVHED